MMRALLVLAMLLVTFAAIEAMARLTYRFIYGEYARGLPLGGTQAAETGTVADERDAPSGNEQVDQAEQMSFLHPFHGYVSKELNDGRRLLPGQRRGRDVAVPRHGQGDALVIAVIGGSVADDVAGQLRTVLHRRISEFGPHRPAEPTLVNLANPGFHQPQQAMVLANMIASGARLDIVVNLDGFNDVSVPGYQARVLGPYGLVHRTWSALALANDHRARIASIRQLRGKARELLTARPWQEPLYGSAVFGLLRRFRVDRIERMIVLEHHQMTDASAMRDGLHGLAVTATRGYVGRDDPQMGAESWYRGSRLMAGVVERQGARYYHFLQPSQYAPLGKPLSDEELASAFAPEHRFAREFMEVYPLTIRYGRRLHADGVKFFDLSNIFAEHRETLYVDICCHLNQRGNELLAEHMMRRIVANERFIEASPLWNGRDQEPSA